MTRINVSFITFSLALFLFSSCANHQTAATLNDIETYIKERPDSALATIRAIDTTSLKTPRLRAHYALLHAMALDKNWIDTTDVNIVKPAVEYYDRHPSGIRRAKAWYYLGRIQQNGGNRPDASISFLRAEKYAEESDDLEFKGLVYLAISTLYSQTHFHEESLKYAERSFTFFSEARDSVNANSSLFCMAKELYNNGRYDEADSLYRLLIDDGRIYDNLKSSLLCDYALSLVTHNEDYEEAVKLFNEVLSSTGSLRKRNYWGAFAYSLLRTEKNKTAEQIFRKIEASQGEAYLSYSYWKSLADAYVGNYDSAYRLQKAAYDIQDENVKKALKQSAIKSQKDFLEVINRESEREYRLRRVVSTCSIFTLLVILIMLSLFFIRRNYRSTQEKIAILQAYSELTSRTEEERAKVRSQYIKICQSHFSHIGRINEMLTVYVNDSDNNLYKELRRSIQRIGLDELSQRRFEKMLDESFDGLMTHFRESFPKRKQRYYQLVSFLFAGFSTTTICTIIPSYNKHNIHVEKSRLKQMIQESDSPYRDQFLRLIL